MVKTITIRGCRFYNIKNRWYPSVTTILKFKPNPTLQKWKESLTEEQVQLISAYTAERGEIIHYASLKTYETDTITQEPFPKENLHYYHLFPKMKAEIRLAYQQFLEFKQKHFLSPVKLESVVWNERYNYAGRVDFIGYLHNGDQITKIPIIADIKTSKEVYTDSLALQLAGYNLAINKRARKCFVLLLHPGKTTLGGVTIGQDEPYWVFQEIIPDYQGFLKWVYMFEPINQTLQQEIRKQELIE